MDETLGRRRGTLRLPPLLSINLLLLLCFHKPDESVLKVWRAALAAYCKELLVERRCCSYVCRLACPHAQKKTADVLAYTSTGRRAPLSLHGGGSQDPRCFALTLSTYTHTLSLSLSHAYTHLHRCCSTYSASAGGGEQKSEEVAAAAVSGRGVGAAGEMTGNTGTGGGREKRRQIEGLSVEDGRMRAFI